MEDIGRVKGREEIKELERDYGGGGNLRAFSITTEITKQKTCKGGKLTAK